MYCTNTSYDIYCILSYISTTVIIIFVPVRLNGGYPIHSDRQNGDGSLDFPHEDVVVVLNGCRVRKYWLGSVYNIII